jgi:hypothetical protein
MTHGEESTQESRNARRPEPLVRSSFCTCEGDEGLHATWCNTVIVLNASTKLAHQLGHHPPSTDDDPPIHELSPAHLELLWKRVTTLPSADDPLARGILTEAVESAGGDTNDQYDDLCAWCVIEGLEKISDDVDRLIKGVRDDLKMDTGDTFDGEKLPRVFARAGWWFEPCKAGDCSDCIGWTEDDEPQQFCKCQCHQVNQS